MWWDWQRCCGSSDEWCREAGSGKLHDRMVCFMFQKAVISAECFHHLRHKQWRVFTLPPISSAPCRSLFCRTQTLDFWFTVECLPSWQNHMMISFALMSSCNLATGHKKLLFYMDSSDVRLSLTVDHPLNTSALQLHVWCQCMISLWCHGEIGLSVEWVI